MVDRSDQLARAVRLAMDTEADLRRLDRQETS
jgi:hypothetical protein